jgi:hypothetical protein
VPTSLHLLVQHPNTIGVHFALIRAH